MHQYIYSKDDLKAILINLVQTGERWEGYDRTVDVANFWGKILSGKGHDDILLSLRPSEKKEWKEQRVRLYNSRTRYISNKIITQIKEVYRSDNIFYDIHFTEKNEDNVERVKGINSSLNNFSGKKSVRQWLRDRFLRLNIIDPNAYIVTNFNIGNDKSISCYPIEVRSKDVLGRQIINGNLQYLAFEERTKEKATVNGQVKTSTGFKYWMFGHDWAILLHKCPDGAEGIGQPIDIREAVNSTLSTDVGKYAWFYSEYNIKAHQVPAACVGYVPDPENDDKTFESIFYPDKELFIELIWKKNTYDIHMTLHGIAQKYAFVPACEYRDTIGNECNLGKIAGDTCPNCHGTGQVPFHTSEQDIICIALPKDKKDIWDLSKMIYYQTIPENIIEMVRNEIEELERKIQLGIFNTTLVDQGKLLATRTATEIRSNSNSTNNVLYEFGMYDADMYKSIITQIAIYSNYWRSDMVVEYSYPNDFNLETMEELVAQLRELPTNSPAIIKSKINSKIIAKLCIDDKSAIHNFQTREYWKPFSEGNQALALPEYDPARILWLYFDQIFRTLEQATYKNPEAQDDKEKEIPFASLPRDKQKAEIDAQVAIYMDQYKTAKEAAPVIKVPRQAVA